MGRVVACGGADGEAWMGKSVLINPNRAWGSDSAVQGKGYEILGMPSDGTFATHVCVPVDRLHLSGGYLKESEAAALPLAMLTAYRALFTRGALQAGERLLITGIGGGVAVMAMQLAIAIGADVYVSSSSEEKIEKAKGMGACGGYNYAASDAAQQAEGLHVAFDMVLDSAAGAELNLYLSLLRPAGRLVLYGATAGLPPTLDMRRLFWKQLSILGSTMGSDQAFEEALAYVERHRIRPVVDKVFAFKDLPAAFSYMSAAKQFAKIVPLLCRWMKKS